MQRGISLGRTASPGDSPSFSGVPPPLDPADEAAWREFVECWQDRVFSLARRVLGDPSLAADATQEVFLLLWRGRASYDRSRPLAPWVYGIAMNTLRGALRGERRRRRREREAAMSEQAAYDRARSYRLEEIERDDELRVVDRHCDALPVEARALLALHYQHGLSQREIARALGWRRHAVQSRIAAVLARLRSALGSHGHLALVPALESTLRRGGLEVAPAPLREALLAVPHGAATLAAGGTGIGILGGAMMSKSSLAALAAIALVSVAIGLGAGVVLRGDGASEHAEREIESLRGRVAALAEALGKAAAEEDALSGRLAAAENFREEAEGRADRLASELALRTAALAAPATGVEETASGTPETIDWAALAATFDENAALLIAAGALLGQGRDLDTELTREQRDVLSRLQLQWNAAGELAKREVEHPFLEPAILEPLLAALLAGPLELTEEQLAGLGAASKALLAEWTEAREGTPLEVWQSRQAVWDGIVAELDTLLAPAQKETWQKLRPVTDGLLEGPERRFTFGLEGKEGIPDRMVEEWRSHYGIAAQQEVRFQQVLADYDRGAREIMHRHLGEQGSPEELPAAARRALQQEYLACQLRAEQALLGILSSEQLLQLRERSPMIWEFEPGGKTSIRISDHGTF